MTLDDNTFQMNGGVILNTDVMIPFVDIDKVTGLDSPPFRETIRDHEGVDGSFIDAEFEQGRDLILEGTAFADVGSIEVLLDSLKQDFAPVTALIPFVFKPAGVDERVLFVKPRGVRYDWDSARRTGQTPIQFLMYAEDPRIYDNSLDVDVINQGGIVTTGFAFNFGFNLSFGVSVTPSGGLVVVGGNRPTPPVFTISGPMTNPRIINTTDGFELDFVITLGMSDSLVVDVANRTVTLNGNTNRRDALITLDWFFLNPGTTSITLAGASGGGSLTVARRNAWR